MVTYLSVWGNTTERLGAFASLRKLLSCIAYHLHDCSMDFVTFPSPLTKSQRYWLFFLCDKLYIGWFVHFIGDSEMGNALNPISWSFYKIVFFSGRFLSPRC
jgi:hypothetical protein